VTAAGATPLLEVKSLTVEFKVGLETKVAVNDLSFSVPRGVIAAVVGESGSGKSTLCRTIAVSLRRQFQRASNASDSRSPSPDANQSC
jgi:ABC-type glutathione transport system ATPase component